MLNLIIAIIGILLTIFFVIGTHEFAHFAAARLLGVKVLRFSIGFGKKIFAWHDKSGTEYVIAVIPLGGYVKMLDETEGEVTPWERDRAYNVQPFYKKFLIVLAGPLMNIFCAFVLYWLTFMIGFTTLKPLIGSITPNSIAANAGLTGNQEIVSIDDRKINSWTGVVFRLVTHLGDKTPFPLQVRNTNGQITTYHLDPSNWQIQPLTPDPLGSMGIVPYRPNVPLTIGEIQKDSPAATSPLRLGDKLILLQGKKINNWDDLISYIQSHPDESIQLTIHRGNQVLTLPVTLGYQRDLWLQKVGYLGIAPKFKLPDFLIRHVQYGPLEALPQAWNQVIDMSYFNLLLLQKMVVGKLSVQSLGGPITIFSSAGSALTFGFLSFIAFLAFLSLSIGIINLIPIPGLDGGHLLFQIIEVIIRRPIPQKVLNIFYYCGFLLILFVLMQSLVNDILRF